MAPIIKTLTSSGRFDVRIAVTGQHRQMLDQVMKFFDMEADEDLSLMRANQGLSSLTGDVLEKMSLLLRKWNPDIVLVQGDTTSTLATALASYYVKVPVAHVEAGLRTGDMFAPWPEEINRKLTCDLASLHFAPTKIARNNLLREGVDPRCIFVTGNTVIDSLMEVVDYTRSEEGRAELGQQGAPEFVSRKNRILVTGHRRESFGLGFDRICAALRRLAERGDTEIIYPMHLNPNVQEPVSRTLGGFDNVRLIEPIDYLSFVRLMDGADVILTDSGGVQEEAPSLGKPVLVMRDTTERPEAVSAGTVRLVGTSEEAIVAETSRLLDDPLAYAEMARAHNPYGDGLAASRIVSKLAGETVTDWHPKHTITNRKN